MQLPACRCLSAVLTVLILGLIFRKGNLLLLETKIKPFNFQWINKFTAYCIECEQVQENKDILLC
jgi:hypothetical protein